MTNNNNERTKEFFEKASTGGTKASSALTLANEIIDKKYHPSAWNIYMFQCSDGDNFQEDNQKFLEEIKKFESCAQLYGYCEIEPEVSWISDSGKLFQLLRPMRSNKLKLEKQKAFEAMEEKSDDINTKN